MGKSTVLKLFGELGAATLDSDQVVTELLRMPDVLDSISALLGAETIDAATGELNRQAVASIIFSDENKRKAYEALIHPMVYSRMQDILGSLRAPIAVVEVPLLFETGHQGDFNRTVAVYADETVALERLQSTGIDRKDALKRLMCQMSIADKVRQSSFTVDNNGEMNITTAQVRQIYRALQALAAEEQA